MDIDGIALPHIVEHGLELGPVHTLAADFFGEPFLDAVLFERFDLAGFVLFFGADADVCNFHGSTSLVGRKIGSEISETFEKKPKPTLNFKILMTFWMQDRAHSTFQLCSPLTI